MSTLITCHTNADFDAFAAMLAVRHLYTSPLLLFPGTQETRLRNVLEGLDKTKYGFIEQGMIREEEITRLVIVDTRKPNRVPHVEGLLGRDGITVEIFDHHPKTSGDIGGAEIHECAAGAVTSFLVLMLREKGVRLEADEATLLALGIYEDTGGFTYSSTTAMDFTAAAWLSEQGMDIERIAELETQQLNQSQVQLLNDLIENSHIYRVNNQDVVIADIVIEESYDCAFLAYQLMEMGKHQVVFVLCQMGGRIQVIARSKSDDINVGAICQLLGGGGHSYAASASIRNVTMPAVREIILRELQLQNDTKTVRAYMSTPPIGIQTTTLIREADEMMFHFGLKSVPVFMPGTRCLAGVFDVQTASRAMNHQLRDVAVEEYMQHRVQTVTPDTLMSDVATIIINNNQRMVPVIEGGEVVGIMTRTDLVNIFAEISTEETPRGTKIYHMTSLFKENQPPWVLNLLQQAGEVGRSLHLAVYAVGGFVRDAILQVPNHDIDLVVEGNGPLFAEALAQSLHGRVSRHDAFLTALVIFRDDDAVEHKIDVATARLEYYERPAALPMVEVSPLKMDLARRDFTINALAVRLDSDTNHLIDFFGGQRDIKDNVIRVLHTLSFVEDPTRCLRAVRFEQRYGFHIGKNTEKLVKNAVQLKVLDHVTHKRLLHEFIQICLERDPCACFERLEELGIMRELLPRTSLSKSRKKLLQQITTHITWYQMLYQKEELRPWILYLWGLNLSLSFKETRDNLERLHIAPAVLNYILAKKTQMRFIFQKIEKWSKETRPRISELWELLKPVEMEVLLFLMAGNNNENLSKHLSKYVTTYRNAKPDIRGKDLIKLGIPPGPVYSAIFAEVLAAKLDGEADDIESQAALAKKIAARGLVKAEKTESPKPRRRTQEQNAKNLAKNSAAQGEKEGERTRRTAGMRGEAAEKRRGRSGEGKGPEKKS
ncbi:MAG: CBS domain-containing protein [Desulfovibrio sp.]|nr:CBS domain-containing protein [Desulfovibrio sp.]